MTISLCNMPNIRVATQRLTRWGVLLFSVILIGATLAIPQAQARGVQALGTLAPGDTVKLNIAGSTSSVEIELDGQALDDQFGLAGDAIVLTLPRDLAGTWHQITVFDTSQSPRKLLGTWEFQTLSTQGDIGLSFTGDVGTSFAGNKSEPIASGAGYLTFEMNGGRSSGSLGYKLSDQGRMLKTGSWFAQHRFALAGQNGALRVGDHSFDTVSQLIGKTARRGASLRVTSPAGTHDTALFAIGASAASATDQFWGIERPDDRLFGIHSNISPWGSSSATVGVTVIDGKAPSLADGTAGSYRGAGLSLLAPISPRFDLKAAFDRSQSLGTATHTGNHFSIGADMAVLPLGQETGAILSLGYLASDQGFFSPLSTHDERGQENYSVGFGLYRPAWYAETTASVGTTNHNGPSTNATDRITKVALDARFRGAQSRSESSDVTMGGSMARQDRVDDGSSGLAAQDHTTWAFYTAYSHVTDRNAFAAQYSYDYFDDRSGGSTWERKHSLEFYLGLATVENTTLNAKLKLTQTQNASSTYAAATLSSSAIFPLIDGKLDYLFNTSIAAYEDPSSTDGISVGTGLSWALNKDHALVFMGTFGEGSKQHTLLGEDGVKFDISIKSDFNLF